MTPQIKYVVGDKRKRPVLITPHVIIGDCEFVATAPVTMREAQEICRNLVADAHPIHEQATKKYHEDVNLEELMQQIRSYDE